MAEVLNFGSERADILERLCYTDDDDISEFFTF